MFAFKESFNKHTCIMKVLWKQSVKSSHKIPSIFLSQFVNCIAFTEKFCFISINFTLKILPEKWKLEVSIKPRTNSNLQAILCGCHQMTTAGSCLDQSTLKCLPSCKTSLSVSSVQKRGKNHLFFHEILVWSSLWQGNCYFFFFCFSKGLRWLNIFN